MFKHYQTSKTVFEPPSLCCPTCQTLLLLVENRLYCERCDRRFKIDNHCISLSDSSTEQEKQDFLPKYMQTLTHEVKNFGWEKGLRRTLKDMSKPEYLELVRFLEPRQFGWRFLMNTDMHGSVLTIDVDFGKTAIELAKSFSRVYLLSFNKNRSVCVAERIREHGINNICCIDTSFNNYLPLPDGFLDSIALTGLGQNLEELCKPIVLKREQAINWLLNEFNRILTPEGEIYISSGNRFNYKKLINIIRRKDTRLPAEVVNSTFSIRGMEKNLKKAGFARSKSYLLLPNYISLSEVVFLEAEDQNKHTNLKETFIRGRGIFKFFASAFLTIGSKTLEHKTMAESLVNHWCTATKKPNKYKYKNPVIRRYLVASPNVVILLVGEKDSHEPGVVFRIPLEEESRKRCEANILALKEINRSNGAISTKAPLPVSYGTFDDQPYFVEQEIPGRIIDRSIPEIKSVISNAAALITQIHRETAVDTVLDEKFFKELVTKPLDTLTEFIQDEQDMLDHQKLGDFLRRTLLNSTLPLVRAHGDYKIENMLVNTETFEVNGIIDWDLSVRHGLPLLDLLHFILYNQTIFTDTDISSLIQEKLIPWEFDDDEQAILKNYISVINIPKESVFSLSIMYWLHHVSCRIGQRMMLYKPLLKHYYFRIIRDVLAKAESSN